MRVLIDKGLGYLSTPQPLQLVEGKLTEASAQYLYGLLLGLTKAINGNLTIGDGSSGSKSGNLFGQFIEVVTPSVAQTEFAVDHALGRIPVAFLVVMTDTANGMRTFASSKGSWTDSRIYLKNAVASATITLWLM